MIHAPSLAEQGDVHVAAHGSAVAGQGNVAVAVLPHLAVRGQLDLHPGQMWAGDVGVGVFGGVGKDRNSRKVKEGWRWGVAADVGTGENNTWTASNTAILGQSGNWKKSEYFTDFGRASVQGEITLVRDGFQFVGVLRHSRVRGRILEKNFRKETGGELETERRERGFEWYATEPALVFRPRLDRQVYWEMQLGSSLQNGRHADEFRNGGLLWPLIIVLGLGGNF